VIGQMNKEFHKRDMAVKILKSKSRRFDVELKQKTELQEAIARIKGEFAERMERQRGKIHRENEKIDRIRSAISVQQQQLELLGDGAGNSGCVPASYFQPRRSVHEQHLPVDLGKDGDTSESEGEGKEGEERGWEWSSQRGGGGVWEEDDGRETPDFLEARGMQEKESFLANVRAREGLLEVLRKEGAAHLMHRLLTRFNVDSCEGFCSLKAAEIENALIPHSEKRKLLEAQLAVRSLASCSHGRGLSSLVTPRGKLSSPENAGAGAGATTAAPITPGWFSQLYKHRNIQRHFSIQVETSELLSHLKAARLQQIWSTLERDGAAIVAAGADKDGFTLLHRVCALPAQVNSPSSRLVASSAELQPTNNVKSSQPPLPLIRLTCTPCAHETIAHDSIREEEGDQRSRLLRMILPARKKGIKDSSSHVTQTPPLPAFFTPRSFEDTSRAHLASQSRRQQERA